MAHYEPSRWQKKSQSADTGTGFTGTLTDLTFNGLVTGRTYEVKGQIQLKSTVDTAFAQTVTIGVVHNAVTIAIQEWLSALKNNGLGDAQPLDPQTQTLPFYAKFVAAAPTLTFSVTANSGGSIKFIGGTNVSFMVLTELNDHVNTTAFT